MHFLCIKKGKTKIRFPILFCLWNRHKRESEAFQWPFIIIKMATLVWTVYFSSTLVYYFQYNTYYIHLLSMFEKNIDSRHRAAIWKIFKNGPKLKRNPFLGFMKLSVKWAWRRLDKIFRQFFSIFDDFSVDFHGGSTF